MTPVPDANHESNSKSSEFTFHSTTTTYIKHGIKIKVDQNENEVITIEPEKPFMP